MNAIINDMYRSIIDIIDKINSGASIKDTFTQENMKGFGYFLIFLSFMLSLTKQLFKLNSS